MVKLWWICGELWCTDGHFSGSKNLPLFRKNSLKILQPGVAEDENSFSWCKKKLLWVDWCGCGWGRRYCGGQVKTLPGQLPAVRNDSTSPSTIQFLANCYCCAARFQPVLYWRFETNLRFPPGYDKRPWAPPIDQKRSRNSLRKNNPRLNRDSRSMATDSSTTLWS